VLELRPITPDDLGAVLALFAQPDMDDGPIFSTGEALALLEEIRTTPHHRVYVAVEDGAVVGTYALLLIQHLSHQGGRSALVEDVVVRTDRQGHGVGRAMMDHAVALAREAGCYKLALSSNLRRTAAHAFYERLGLEKHGYSFRLAPPA